MADVRKTLYGWDLLLQGSYSTDEAEFVTDADYTIQRPLFAVLHAVEQERFRNYSGEFRVSSPREARIRTLLGL